MKYTLYITLILFTVFSCSKSAESYFEEGDDNFDLDKYEAAISSYSEAIRINPKYEDAYRKRGHSKSRLGRHKDAIIDFNHALEIDPEDYRVYLRKAFSLYKLNQPEKSIIEINKLLSIYPEYTKAYVLRAAIYYDKMDCKNTILDFDKVTDVEPHNPLGYYIKANYKFKFKDYTGAVADYTKAIEISHGFELYLNSKKRYFSMIMQGDDNEVVQNDYLKAQELYYPSGESNFSNYNTLSPYCYKSISLKMFKIISHDPKNINAYILFGYSFSKIRKKNTSINDLSAFFNKNVRFEEVDLKKKIKDNKNKLFDGGVFLE